MTIAIGAQALAADVLGLFEKTAIPFWGTIAEIPVNFIICDGNNGTPNLLAKFLQGVATAITNPGATGGALNKTTEGHTHTSFAATPDEMTTASANSHINTTTDTIADIRPPYYDVAFITFA